MNQTPLALLAPRMADKVISGGRPRQKYRQLTLGGGDASQPLLPLASAPDPSSNPPKGSPGENAMRGVRKLSICNIPQAWISIPLNTRASGLGWKMCYMYVLFSVHMAQ